MTAGAGLDGEAVRRSVAALGDLLRQVPDGEADVPAVGTSVAGVVAHLNSCLAFYAHDLAAGRDEVTAVDLVRRPEAGLPALTAGVVAWGEVLARTLEAAAPQDRGWHSHGVADPIGFAAIGCAEVLVHGHDVADALGLPWSPPRDVVAAVLARLFPDVGPEPDPITALLWATGRAELPGRGRRESWSYAMTPAGE